MDKPASSLVPGIGALLIEAQTDSTKEDEAKGDDGSGFHDLLVGSIYDPVSGWWRLLTGDVPVAHGGSTRCV